MYLTDQSCFADIVKNTGLIALICIIYAHLCQIILQHGGPVQLQIRKMRKMLDASLTLFLCFFDASLVLVSPGQCVTGCW